MPSNTLTPASFQSLQASFSLRQKMMVVGAVIALHGLMAYVLLTIEPSEPKPANLHQTKPLEVQFVQAAQTLNATLPVHQQTQTIQSTQLTPTSQQPQPDGENDTTIAQEQNKPQSTDAKPSQQPTTTEKAISQTDTSSIQPQNTQAQNSEAQSSKPLANEAQNSETQTTATQQNTQPLPSKTVPTANSQPLETQNLNPNPATTPIKPQISNQTIKQPISNSPTAATQSSSFNQKPKVAENPTNTNGEEEPFVHYLEAQNQTTVVPITKGTIGSSPPSPSQDKPSQHPTTATATTTKSNRQITQKPTGKVDATVNRSEVSTMPNANDSPNQNRNKSNSAQVAIPNQNRDKAKDASNDNKVVDFSAGDIDWVKAPVHRFPSGVRAEAGQVFEVTLQLIVDKQGKIESITVTKSSQNPLIDKAAIEQTRYARLTPFRQNGVAAKGRVNYTIAYKNPN